MHAHASATAEVSFAARKAGSAPHEPEPERVWREPERVWREPERVWRARYPTVRGERPDEPIGFRS
jgi:hypothetical protein